MRGKDTIWSLLRLVVCYQHSPATFCTPTHLATGAEFAACSRAWWVASLCTAPRGDPPLGCSWRTSPERPTGCAVCPGCVQCTLLGHWSLEWVAAHGELSWGSAWSPQSTSWHCAAAGESIRQVDDYHKVAVMEQYRHPSTAKHILHRMLAVGVWAAEQACRTCNKCTRVVQHLTKWGDEHNAITIY